MSNRALIGQCTVLKSSTGWVGEVTDVHKAGAKG